MSQTMIVESETPANLDEESSRRCRNATPPSRSNPAADPEFRRNFKMRCLAFLRWRKAEVVAKQAKDRLPELDLVEFKGFLHEAKARARGARIEERANVTYWRSAAAEERVLRSLRQLPFPAHSVVCRDDESAHTVRVVDCDDHLVLSFLGEVYFVPKAAVVVL